VVQAGPAPTPAPTPPEIRIEPRTPTQELVSIIGEVRDSDGNPLARARVIVIAGERKMRLRSDSDGRFIAPNVPAGSFVAWAERRDGALSIRSAQVALETVDGGEYEIELVVPAAITGGLGINLRPHPDGARIGSVIPDGQGEYIGLQPGDVILEVNNVDLGGMSLSEVALLIKGPEGTGGILLVRRAGSGAEEDLKFEREFVDKVRRRPR
jgi:hypothetical protein